MGSRKGFSSILILGALVLVVAIFVGNNMGNRVLRQITSRTSGVETPIPIPSSSPADAVGNRALWKRRQVLSVATDPAFPDPRITPEPEMTATPVPRRSFKPESRRWHHSAKATETAPAEESTPDTTYTPPPLPGPIVTHGADETSAPDEAASAGPRGANANARPQNGTPRGGPTPRPYPTLPPVSFPSSNP